MASRADWDAKYRSSRNVAAVADPFLVEALGYVRSAAPAAADAVDVACGRGQHAIELAAHGFKTVAVDHSLEALRQCSQRAAERGLSIEALCIDLESCGIDLDSARFDVVAVFRYLHRPLVPLLKRIVRPGGIIIYKTFTYQQVRFAGGPRTPDYLLDQHELPGLFGEFRHLLYRETCETEATAALIAQRP